MSKDYTRVGEYGRRVTQDIAEGKEKLEQKVINFEKLEEAGLKDGKWDVVFITYVKDSLNWMSFAECWPFHSLATTRSLAGSAAAFEEG